MASLSILLELCLLASAADAQQSPETSSASAPGGWQLGPFLRPRSGNPVISPDNRATFTDPILKSEVHWEALHTFNPAAVVRRGKVYILYRAEDDSGSMAIGMHTSRLGLAESKDGVHFKSHRFPVLFPDEDAQRDREWPGGVEDPRIVETDQGTYVLTYTQWNRQTYSVGVATSRDLVHWTKHSPAFGDTGKYANLKYKSAGIVTQLKDGQLKAAKIGGKYWMYWGEIHVHLATSSDLIHWTPVEDETGALKELLSPRAGMFDSGFAEVGAPPIVTEKGIVVIYNGKNAAQNGDQDGDPDLQPGAYSAGQALFSLQDLARMLARSDSPFLYPAEAYERSGQYSAGTTFAESLVFFKGRWFIYYGCADSLVAAVVQTPEPLK